MSDLHDVDVLLPPKYLPSGEAQDIVAAIRSGAWLHVANIWIYRTAPSLQILFQQRDNESPFSPGLLDCSAAGYLHAGESAADGGLREMEEELGLKASRDDLINLGRHLNAGLDHKSRERKWVINKHAYEWNHELADLRMNPAEVPGCFWIDVNSLLSIEKGETSEIKGLSAQGEAIERAVSASDFVYNVDDYHFRIAERIRNIASK